MGLRLAALALVLTLHGCATAIVEPAIQPRELALVHADPATALAWLNAYRAQKGLGPVRLDAALTAVAQRQADAMAAADAVSHDVDGSLSARLVAAGVRVGEAGENICAGYYSTTDAMVAWRDSPEHDAQLRMPAATRFGVALAKNKAGRWGAYWAMAIATPAPEAH